MCVCASLFLCAAECLRGCLFVSVVVLCCVRAGFLCKCMVACVCVRDVGCVCLLV